MSFENSVCRGGALHSSLATRYTSAIWAFSESSDIQARPQVRNMLAGSTAGVNIVKRDQSIYDEP